jgi:nuclear pore complex protein Nup160
MANKARPNYSTRDVTPFTSALPTLPPSPFSTMENFLISTHVSSLSTALTPLSTVIRTTRQQLPLPHPLDHNNIPAEHAIFASVIDAEATGTVLLRLIHGGLIVELVSLSTDVQPLRLIFPSVLLNNPAVFLEDQELHVLAVTEFGSLYRVIVPLQDRDLWKNQAENVWPKEYMIKDFPQNTRGCFVQAQGIYCVAISIPNGSLLRLDVDSLGYDGHEGTRSPTSPQ